MRQFLAPVIAGLVSVHIAAGVSITSLGVLPGGTFSYAIAVNDSGQVVGGGNTAAGIRGFVYSNGGGLVELPTLAGGDYSYAQAVNAAGEVVGISTSSEGLRGIRTHSGVFESIDAPLGGDTSALGINGARQVVGSSNNQAYIYDLDTGVATNLSALLGDGTFSSASAINESGDVTGAVNVSGAARAFRYEAATGAMSALPTLAGGNSGSGATINDSGQIAGWSNSSSGIRAFLFTPGVGTLDLGILAGGTRSEAQGINDAGHVVGRVQGDADRAFLYTLETGMIDLNSLLPAGSGWILTDARDINNNGQIVGGGIFNGEQRAFLLDLNGSPSVPEPGTAVFGSLAVALAIAGARRRRLHR